MPFHRGSWNIGSSGGHGGYFESQQAGHCRFNEHLLRLDGWWYLGSMLSSVDAGKNKDIDDNGVTIK